MIVSNKLLAVLILLGPFPSSVNAAGVPESIPQATTCPAIAAGATPISMPELSAEMVTTLRGILADVFLNSDKIFQQYFQANPATPSRISVMGSSISANSYGIYRMQVPGQVGESVMKVPLKWSYNELMDYFEGGALVQKFDPTDLSDTSEAAVESRRISGFGLLLLHFFKIMESKTGIQMSAPIQAYYSSRQLTPLLIGDLRLSPDRARVFTNEGSRNKKGELENSLKEEDLPSFGIVTGKLDIVSESREDAGEEGKKPQAQQFPYLPGVKEQVIWLSRILNQLRIEILDPNPVLDRNGHVYILDLENSAVAVNVNGKMQVFLGLADEGTRISQQTHFDNDGWYNKHLLGRLHLLRKDLD